MVDNRIKIRKKEHIEGFLRTYSQGDNGFDRIKLYNNSLPEVSFNEISLKSRIFNKEIGAPIIINAITGGTQDAEEINRNLAELAREFKLPMAVGSQSVGLKYEDAVKSYRCVREILGEDGVVISNLSANRKLEEVKQAVDMIRADGVQLHLNVLQELCMEEGDRDFKGIVENIKYIKENLHVPVIAKEVGFGISEKTALKLKEIGIDYIDVGGKGGTNFVQIEDSRYESRRYEEFYSFGITTAESLILTKRAYPESTVISSGGIRTAGDVVKSLILGADYVGISGILLERLLKEGYEAAEKTLRELIRNVKIYMTVLGAGEIEQLREVDYGVERKE